MKKCIAAYVALLASSIVLAQDPGSVIKEYGSSVSENDLARQKQLINIDPATCTVPASLSLQIEVMKKNLATLESQGKLTHCLDKVAANKESESSDQQRGNSAQQVATVIAGGNCRGTIDLGKSLNARRNAIGSKGKVVQYLWSLDPSTCKPLIPLDGKSADSTSPQYKQYQEQNKQRFEQQKSGCQYPLPDWCPEYRSYDKVVEAKENDAKQAAVTVTENEQRQRNGLFDQLVTTLTPKRLHTLFSFSELDPVSGSKGIEKDATPAGVNPSTKFPNLISAYEGVPFIASVSRFNARGSGPVGKITDAGGNVYDYSTNKTGIPYTHVQRYDESFLQENYVLDSWEYTFKDFVGKSQTWALQRSNLCYMIGLDQGVVGPHLEKEIAAHIPPFARNKEFKVVGQEQYQYAGIPTQSGLFEIAVNCQAFKDSPQNKYKLSEWSAKATFRENAAEGKFDFLEYEDTFRGYIKQVILPRPIFTVLAPFNLNFNGGAFNAVKEYGRDTFDSDYFPQLKITFGKNPENLITTMDQATMVYTGRKAPSQGLKTSLNTIPNKGKFYVEATFVSTNQSNPQGVLYTSASQKLRNDSQADPMISSHPKLLKSGTINLLIDRDNDICMMIFDGKKISHGGDGQNKVTMEFKTVQEGYEKLLKMRKSNIESHKNKNRCNMDHNRIYLAGDNMTATINFGDQPWKVNPPQGFKGIPYNAAEAKAFVETADVTTYSDGNKSEGVFNTIMKNYR